MVSRRSWYPLSATPAHLSNSCFRYVLSCLVMDLKQLGALAAIADHGSFSAAARALHTVQSNVSTHIARLERELGAALVDRSTGELTDAGLAVLERARRIDTELGAIESDVVSLTAETAGTTRFGIIGTTARWLVPPLLEEMSRRHPRVTVVVVDAVTTLLLPQLASSQLELALVNLPVDEPDVAVEPLFDEDLVLVAPLGHEICDAERLTLSDLAHTELLLSAPGTAFRAELDAAAAAAGVALVPQAEIDGMRLLASLAFQGFGAAVLPASAAPGWIGGEWRRIPLDGVGGRAVGLARRRRDRPSAATRAVAEVVVDVVRHGAESQTGIHPA